MPTLPPNPQSIGSSGHVNDHNTIVTNLNYILNQYQMGNKNRVINGNFAVNQRAYTSGTNLASGSYGFDRWKSGYTNTSLTFTSAPQGQTVTISTSGVIQQIIEQANIPAGSYTLTWTGTATGRVYNSGASAPAYAASPVTVSLDGSANVVVEFTASGGTKTLGNVQLEAGTSATVFEFEPYETTLRKCQRYYYRVFPNTSGYPRIGTGQCASATAAAVIIPLPVPMRTAPSSTIDTSGSASHYALTTAAIGIQALNALPVMDKFWEGSVAVSCAVASGLGGAGTVTQMCINNTTSGYLGFSAEL